MRHLYQFVSAHPSSASQSARWNCLDRVTVMDIIRANLPYPTPPPALLKLIRCTNYSFAATYHLLLSDSAKSNSFAV